MAAELTDEQIEAAVTQAVKSGKLPWAGFREDEEGRFTLPVLSRVHYGLVRLGLALATQQAAQGAEPVAEVYRLHYGGRMRNIGVNAVRQLVPSDKLPPPGTKLYTSPPPTAEVEKDAALWREHVSKLDALVTYCPTCCAGFTAKPEMTRDEVIFECGKTVGRGQSKALREALQRLHYWAQAMDPKYTYTGDHPIAQARAALQSDQAQAGKEPKQ